MGIVSRPVKELLGRLIVASYSSLEIPLVGKLDRDLTSAPSKWKCVMPTGKSSLITKSEDRPPGTYPVRVKTINHCLPSSYTFQRVNKKITFTYAVNNLLAQLASCLKINSAGSETITRFISAQNTWIISVFRTIKVMSLSHVRIYNQPGPSANPSNCALTLPVSKHSSLTLPN